MDPENRKELEEAATTKENRTEKVTRGPVPVYAELAETEPEHIEADDMQSLALAYAKYLAGKGLKPGDATFIEPEEIAYKETEKVSREETASEETEKASPEDIASKEIEMASPEEVNSEETGKAPDKSGRSAKAGRKRRKQAKPAAKERKPGRADLIIRNYGRKPTEKEIKAAERRLASAAEKRNPFVRMVDMHDRTQIRIDDAVSGVRQSILRSAHSIVSSYRHSRRTIGIAVLVIGILAVAVMILFDKYTAYEYSYNGKVLGYVNSQEEVIDVLDIAGNKLTENNGGREIVFTANQNVTFNTIDARGKSIDDADAAVNKLVYMTDIETEAFGIFEGGRLAAVVKSEKEAESILTQVKASLSKPDDGMEVVSSEYTKDIEVRPLNVLLTSVQSSNYASKLMTEGGALEIFHIVEQDETIAALAERFGTRGKNIYDENGRKRASGIETGDTVCIRTVVDPVTVKMVETGRMKEVVEFETIKQESEDYYKGDVVTEQEGINGLQIFEGTITKISGEVTKRDEEKIEVIRHKQDKILLIGTAERPLTAPTGTYIVPLDHYEGITSPFGYRWGRLHSGIDMGAHHGEPIHATDGGTIQRAGWYYGYGLCVEIDHGGGRMTRYGHCSAILVNVGDKVYQGQEIALVGNTGHSFGNHLHFEVNFNGTPVNPRPYLGI